MIKSCSGMIFAAMLALGQEKSAKQDLVEREIAGDRFMAGGAVRVNTPVAGDLFASGGSVSVRAEVQGDAVAAGGDVRLESPIKQGGVYAAGGRVLVNTEVSRNIRMAGGTIEVGPQSQIHGNASLVGGQIEILGTVNGYLQATGGRVYINAPVAWR